MSQERKETDKLYYHHTGFPGGIKSISLGKMRDKIARENS